MRVVLALQSQRQFDRLPTLIKVRMISIFERLKKWPNVSGAKPLRGKLSGNYRMRTGDYRVQFKIIKTSIVITKIGHRDRFYDE